MIILSSGAVFSQTEEQKKHPKYPELTKHLELYSAAKQKGDINGAILEELKALDLAKEIFGEESILVSAFYNGIANDYYSMGEYDKAYEFFTKSLSIRLKILGENHPDVAASYNNLGSVHNTKGDSDKAIECHRKSLSIRLKRLNENHIDVITSYNNLGSAYKSKGDYDKAIEFLSKSAAGIRNTLGENHPFTATSYNNLGTVYQEKGDYDRAIELHRKSLAIRLKIFGEDHTDTGMSYNNLGMVYVAKGDYEKAIESFLKSLQIYSKALGNNHPDLAIPLNNIGLTYREMGNDNKAIEFYFKSFAILSKSLGESHPSVATSYNNLGTVYYDKGEYEKAIEYFRKALEIRLRTLGENHPDLAASYNNLGAVYKSKGEYEKAIEYYKKSFGIMIKTLEENHPDVATSYNNLGSVYNEKGEYEKAIEYYQKSLGIRLKTLGENHPDVATSYNNLGSVYQDRKEFEKAAEFYIKSLFIRMKTLGENHPSSATSYSSLGSLYSSNGLFEEAIEYYGKSLDIRLKTLGENHSDVAASFSNLGSVYQKKGEYKKAIEYNQKSLGILRKSEDRLTYLVTLDNAASLYLKLKKTPEAIATFEEAVSVVLKARTEIVGKDKQSFTEKHIHFFKELVDLYNQTGQPQKAFEINEKMRGLSILENFQLQFALRESKVNQKTAEEMLNRKGKIESLYSEYSAVTRQGEKANVYAKSLKDNILKEESILERMDKELEKSNPLYAKNRKIRIPEISALQKKLGDAGKTLLEFTLSKDIDGKETLSAFVISKGKFQSVVLGSKLNLSLAIQNLRQIISRNPKERTLILARGLNKEDIILGYGESEYLCKYPSEEERKRCSGFEEGTEIFREEQRNEKDRLKSLEKNRGTEKVWKKFAVMEREIPKEESTEKFMPLYLKEIYTLVISPLLEKNLIENREILISPDSSLFTVPFAALRDAKGEYFGNHYSISMIHSASIWMKLSEYEYEKFSHLVYAMGNPLYSFGHSETRSVRAADLRAVAKGGSMESLKLGNLKGSKEELFFLSEKIYQQEKSEHIQMGLSANKSELSERFAERKPVYKTVHFSVHGLFFPDAEELNSLALTSRKKAEEADKESLLKYEAAQNKKLPEDGFLKMGDVIDLGIKTDLVIMSACETSLGSERAGEGMVGLPQAFLLAGSQNTMATLWSVDDHGTMLFFKKFYHHYILSKMDLKANKSLQTSQKEIYSAKDKNQYIDPYYWAAFVIYGE